ncbi:MAG: hypothetical protein OEV91_02700 [Desulfobulbaceae bacterium]|nr:hypothetical protein [Desulfobulbaceae bacterium]
MMLAASLDAISERFRAAGKLERVRSARAQGWLRKGIAQSFSLGIVLHIPAIAARALLATVNPIGRPSAGQAPIWILSKEGLVEDSLASIDEAPWAAPYDFSRLCLKLLAERMLPKFLDDNVYASPDPAVAAAKQRVREKWRQVLQALPRSRRPAAIVTSNFGYFVEREFAGACAAEGIPFVAIHKECFKAPGRLRFFATTYPRRGPFTGSRVLVYNNYERDLLVATGIVPASVVTVTGMPRLDRIHAWRRTHGMLPRPARQVTLLAFAFTPTAGLPRIPRKERTGVSGGLDPLAPEFAGLAWESLFVQYHQAIVQMARDNPDLRVILKTKGRERDGRPALDFIQSLAPPPNLETVVGGDLLPLLTVSDAVIGFNTTALCEAIAAGLPVVVPDFAEATARPTVEYVVDLGAAVFHAGSPQELAELAVALARDPAARWPNLDPAREAVLHLWMANADGQAGVRVSEAIRAEGAKTF